MGDPNERCPHRTSSIVVTQPHRKVGIWCMCYPNVRRVAHKSMTHWPFVNGGDKIPKRARLRIPHL